MFAGVITSVPMAVSGSPPVSSSSDTWRRFSISFSSIVRIVGDLHIRCLMLAFSGNERDIDTSRYAIAFILGF